MERGELVAVSLRSEDRYPSKLSLGRRKNLGSALHFKVADNRPLPDTLVQTPKNNREERKSRCHDINKPGIDHRCSV